MRIKKKDIKESIAAAASSEVKDMEDTIQQTKSNLEDMGIDEPAEIAGELVRGAIEGSKDLNEINQDVLDDMISTYGSEEAAKKVYYATANKQDRDEETFEKNEEVDPGTGEDFGDIPTGRDLEVDGDDYEEYQNLLKQVSNDGPSVDLDSVDDGLPFESVRPRMTKSELTEAVKNIGKNIKYPRTVLKTFKKKDLRR